MSALVIFGDRDCVAVCEGDKVAPNGARARNRFTLSPSSSETASDAADMRDF